MKVKKKTIEVNEFLLDDKEMILLGRVLKLVKSEDVEEREFVIELRSKINKTPINTICTVIQN